MKKVIPLLCVVYMLLLQSCDFYDMGKKDPKIILPPPSSTTYTIDYDREARGNIGSSSCVLPNGLEVNPIVPVTFDNGTTVLMLTSDSCQLLIRPYLVKPELSLSGDKSLNNSFRHYDNTPLSELTDIPLVDVIERWGDYIYMIPADEPGYVEYYYPYIKLLCGGKYFNGVLLRASSDGIVREVEPMNGIHKNLFGKLPFYDKILSFNIMQWLMPGPWLEKGAETPSRGIFFSILYSFVIYGIVLLILTLICAAIYIPVDRNLPAIRIYVGVILVIGAFLVAYIFLISLLDYYSAAWWLTVLFLVTWTFLPMSYIMSSARHYCPKCHGTDWRTEGRITEVTMPKLQFNLKWIGNEPSVEPDRNSSVPLTYTDKKICQSCGYSEDSRRYEEHHRRDICPRCYRETFDGRYTSYKWSGYHITAEYEEKCSVCGYKEIYTLNKTIQSRPVSSPGRPSSPSRQSGGSDRRDDLKKGCWYCRHGNGSNIVGDDAICTAGLDSGKRCNYGYDQTQCPYYKPYC